MKKRVEELVRESMDINPEEPKVSVSVLRISLKKGEPYKGSFSVGRKDKEKGLRSYVVSDNNRIVIAKRYFDEPFFKVVYGIDTAGLMPSDRVEGKITVITSCGQLEIPVFAEVEGDKLVSATKEITSLEEFATLAKTSFHEAFRLYVSESFSAVLTGKNASLLPVYEGLSQNPVTYQHLEEFLITAKQKEKITLSVDKQEKPVYRISDSVKDTLYIYKNTWGYVNIEIFVYGDFIETEKKTVTSEDFIGKMYGLEYIINADKVKNGARTGKIVLKTVYETIELEIEAAPSEMSEYHTVAFRTSRSFGFFKSLLLHLTKETDFKAWREKAYPLLEDLKEDREDLFTRYCEVLLACGSGNYAGAIELLWDIKEGMIIPKKPWERAAYLYFAKWAGLLPDEQRDISENLMYCFLQDPTCFYPLYFYIEEEKRNGAPLSELLSVCEDAYEKGCNSPFIYYQAWTMISRQENLLKRLSPFMIRVLAFAEKYGLLHEETVMRAAFLSSAQKPFSEVLFKVLSKNYERFPKKELLEAITKYLIKGNRTDSSYFKWYEKAVEADIRVTRLYEYYMETRPENITTEFPLPVRLYFSYNSTLGERKKAYLYAGIIRHKDKDPVSYENYSAAIREFAGESFRKGLINENYAVLYEEFFADSKDQETAADLSMLMFTCKLECSNPSIKKVIVVHPDLTDEREYVLVGGRAYPSIYNDDARIILEDEMKRRFVSTIPYRLTGLMDRKKAADYCASLGVWDTGLMVYTCGKLSWEMEATPANLLKLWKTAENPEIKRSRRDKIRMKLLEYFASHDGSNIEAYVDAMRDSTYGSLDKVKTTSLLIRYGKYERAMAMLARFGYEDIKLPELLLLASDRIASVCGELDEHILDLAVYIFRHGIFNTTTLDYLCRYAFFNIEESLKLWENASENNLDTTALEEKILMLSMLGRVLSDKTEAVLESYAGGSGSRMVTRAFLTYISMKSVMNDVRIKDSTARLIGTLVDSETVRVKFCILAWLKYASGLKNPDAEEEERIGRLLSYCDENGYRLSFLKRLPSKFLQGYQMEDKVFIEEKFKKDSSVTLYYRLDKKGTRDDDIWTSEPLNEVLPGLYVREFLLFYGERLHYYCTVQNGEVTETTEEKQITVTTIDMEGNTKYRRLNAIKAKLSLIENVPISDEVRRYLWQEAASNELFKVITSE